LTLKRLRPMPRELPKQLRTSLTVCPKTFVLPFADQLFTCSAIGEDDEDYTTTQKQSCTLPLVCRCNETFSYSEIYIPENNVPCFNRKQRTINEIPAANLPGIIRIGPVAKLH